MMPGVGAPRNSNVSPKSHHGTVAGRHGQERPTGQQAKAFLSPEALVEGTGRGTSHPLFLLRPSVQLHWREGQAWGRSEG